MAAIVLVNRRSDGTYEVFDNLVFHGGKGATLELRVFSESDLRQHLATAGFTDVHIGIQGSPQFGVSLDNPCSLPIAASRG